MVIDREDRLTKYHISSCHYHNSQRSYHTEPTFQNKLFLLICCCAADMSAGFRGQMNSKSVILEHTGTSTQTQRLNVHQSATGARL